MWKCEKSTADEKYHTVAMLHYLYFVGMLQNIFTDKGVAQNGIY